MLFLLVLISGGVLKSLFLNTRYVIEGNAAMSHAYLPYVVGEIKLDEVLKLEPSMRVIDVRLHKISSSIVGCEVIVDKYLATPLVLIDTKGNIAAITGFYVVYDEDSRELVILDFKFNRVQTMNNVVRIYKLSYNSMLIIRKEDVKLLVMDNTVHILKIDVDPRSKLIKYIGNKAYLGLLFATKEKEKYCIIVDVNKVQVVFSIHSKIIDLTCNDEEVYVCYMKGRKIILKRLPRGDEVHLGIKRVKYLELSINSGFLTLNYISCDEEYTLILNCELNELLKVKKKGLSPLYGELNEVYVWDPVSGIVFIQVNDKRIPLIKCNNKPSVVKHANKLYILCNYHLHEVCKHSWRPVARVNEALIHGDYVISFTDMVVEVFKVEDPTFKIMLRRPDNYIILSKGILILCYGLRIFVVDLQKVINTSSILIEDLHNSNKPVLAHISVYVPKGLVIDNIEVQNARFKVYRTLNGFEVLIYELKYINEANLIANEINFINLRLKFKSVYLVNDFVMNFKVKLKKPVILIKRRPLVVYCNDGSIKIGSEYYGNALLWMRIYAFNPLPRPLITNIRIIVEDRSFDVGNISIKENFIVETDTYLKINFSENVRKLINRKDIKVMLIVKEQGDIVVNETNGVIVVYENPIEYIYVSEKPIEFEPYSAKYKVTIKLRSHTDLVYVFAEGGLKGCHKFYLEPGKHELIVRFAPRPSNLNTSINVRCVKYIDNLNMQLSWTYTLKLCGGEMKVSFKVFNGIFKKEELRHGYIHLPIYLNDKLSSYGFVTAINAEDNRVLATVCVRSGFNEIKIPLTETMDYKDQRSIPIALDYFNGAICIRRLIFITVLECPVGKIVPIIRPCNRSSVELILALDSTKNDVRILLYNVEYDNITVHRIKRGLNYVKILDIQDFQQFEFIVYIVYNNVVWERRIRALFDVKVGLLLAYNLAKILYSRLDNCRIDNS